MRELLALIRAHKLKLKASKCEFFKPAVEFLGFFVDAEGLHVEEAKVKAIKDWATPKSQKELRAFMGLASFYRKFIFRFAHKALPLYELAAQTSTFQWTDDCERSFQVLKKCLCKAPILALPTTTGSCGRTPVKGLLGQSCYNSRMILLVASQWRRLSPTTAGSSRTQRRGTLLTTGNFLP